MTWLKSQRTVLKQLFVFQTKLTPEDLQDMKVLEPIEKILESLTSPN